VCGEQDKNAHKWQYRLGSSPRVLGTGDRTIPVGGTFGGAPSPLIVTNMDTRLVPETEITATVVFAGAGTSTEYRKRHALCEA
jgi:hypothetical protein